MEPPSTPFALQTSFPPVIFSYCTKTDGGRGEQRMWQIANFLKKHGIASFNGKQVEVGEDWMQKWLGKMPEADVCLAMLGPEYFASGPCKREIYQTARKGVTILPIIFETPPPLKKGYFAMNLGNWLPTPDEGLFQDNWEANLAKLLVQVKKYVSADSIGPPEHDVATDVAKMSIAPRAPAAAAETTEELALGDGIKYGTAYLPDGIKYVGHVKDGKPLGEGTMNFANGNKYIGQWKIGVFHGQGTDTTAEGDKYVGQYKHDKMHGLGKVFRANGELAFDGEFKKGKPKV